MRMPSRLNPGTVAFRAYLKSRGAKKPIQLAAAMGVSLPTVYRYKNGGVPASKPIRAALDRETGGAVPEHLWDK